MVFGVRLQVLGELPDARGGERDLDFGGPRVFVGASVLGDQLAFDFRLYCQTESELYLRENRRVQTDSATEPSDRGSAPARHTEGPSMTMACAWPSVSSFGGLSSTGKPERTISGGPGESASTETR